jgi:hypothetical protein
MPTPSSWHLWKGRVKKSSVLLGFFVWRGGAGIWLAGYRSTRGALKKNSCLYAMELQIEPIMVGKKKTKDIQFYVTVIDAVESLEQNRKSYYDPEEIEEEQREKERRAKVNQVRPRTAMKEFVCESDHWG